MKEVNPFVAWGQVGTIEFWDNCHIYLCLFAMTPNPSSNHQEVLLLPDWTLSRIAAEMGVTLDTMEKRKYATCVLVALQPSSIHLPFAIRAHRGDGMCLIEDDLGPGRTLGGKKVTESRVDVKMVEDWLGRCVRLHASDCAPVRTEELQEIRLVDVHSRQIVPYPRNGCEYVALSYVWGGVTRESFTRNDAIMDVPQTLEDAISFTKALGKQYLWADSLCIDQSDEDDIASQVGRMWSIYRGAYLTLIALSGASAETGLSKLSRNETYPQLTCCIKGRRLVGIMPTLSQQNWVCPWSNRAWTLQEAMLSPRCLYFSDHQLYFDCTAMLCCESLDHSRSLAHSLTQSSNPTDVGFVTWMMDQIGAGAYRNPLDDKSKRLQHWGMKVTLYSYRVMTFNTDGLRAFDGILQRLQTMYPEGFVQGLPAEDLNWGLVWYSQWPSMRREGFPSWSWAGWQGGMWYGQPRDVSQTRRFPVHLEIFQCKSDQVSRVFRMEEEFRVGQDNITVLSSKDPVHRAAQTQPEEFRLTLDEQAMAEREHILLLDAVCLHFAPDFSMPQRNVQIAGQFEYFKFKVDNVKCFLYLISIDREIREKFNEAQTFILMARDLFSGHISHHLLMVHEEPGSNIATRATALQLLIPHDKLHVLEKLSPIRRHIRLA